MRTVALCACALVVVAACAVTATANRASAHARALVDETNLVTYDPCGAPKCVPRSLQLQDPRAPVIPGYACDCNNMDEKKECGCAYSNGVIDVPCKDGGCPKVAITRIVNPHAPPPRAPINIVRKFSPSVVEPAPNASVPTSGPFALPPLRKQDCVANVAGYGPGNCARKVDSGVYCQENDSNCKNGDNASAGMAAATLDSPATKDDKDEQCSDQTDGSQSLASSQQNANGDQVRATITITNKCTGKKTTLNSKDVHINPPVILQRNPDGSLTPSTLPPNAQLVSSESSQSGVIVTESGSQSAPAGSQEQSGPMPGMQQSSVAAAQSSAVGSTTAQGVQMQPVTQQKQTAQPQQKVLSPRFSTVAADMPVPSPMGVLTPGQEPTIN